MYYKMLCNSHNESLHILYKHLVYYLCNVVSIVVVVKPYYAEIALYKPQVRDQFFSIYVFFSTYVIDQRPL